MNVDGWSLEEIRRWLGHTSKETTLKYIFNPYRQDEMKEKRKKHPYYKIIKTVFKIMIHFKNKKILENHINSSLQYLNY